MFDFPATSGGGGPAAPGGEPPAPAPPPPPPPPAAAPPPRPPPPPRPRRWRRPPSPATRHACAGFRSGRGIEDAVAPLDERLTKLSGRPRPRPPNGGAPSGAGFNTSHVARGAARAAP